MRGEIVGYVNTFSGVSIIDALCFFVLVYSAGRRRLLFVHSNVDCKSPFSRCP